MSPKTPNRFVLALGGLVFASLAVPAMAQGVEIGADGSVRVEGADGVVVQTDATGTRVRGAGATIEADGRQDVSSRSGDHRQRGDNVQRTRGDVDGGVHVQASDGGRATTTIGNRSITSSSTASGTSAGGVMPGYVNQDLSGSDFSGRRLEAVAFVNSVLRRADFRDAILIGANFANAELADADFRGANLRNARLTNAGLSGARFDGATWMDGRVCGEGSVGGCR